MTLRELRAAQKRVEREARQRIREIEKQRNLQAKLNALEQAKLEVEMHESHIALLLSIHRERGPQWDWVKLAAALRPAPPIRIAYNEFKCRLSQLSPYNTATPGLEPARLQDESLFQQTLTVVASETAGVDETRLLANRILVGDSKAYVEALRDFGPLSELSELGSSIHFTVHSSQVLEATVTVGAREAIPQDVKTLTASGKVSTKLMPKSRFHEIYQDYICGCVLRVGLEAFALLPISTVVITAEAELSNNSRCPVLSVAMERGQVSSISWKDADASNTIEQFLHRGDAKASRRSGQFVPITPLTIADLPKVASNLNLGDLIAHSRSVQTSFNQF